MATRISTVAEGSIKRASEPASCVSPARPSPGTPPDPHGPEKEKLDRAGVQLVRVGANFCSTYLYGDGDTTEPPGCMQPVSAPHAFCGCRMLTRDARNKLRGHELAASRRPTTYAHYFVRKYALVMASKCGQHISSHPAIYWISNRRAGQASCSMACQFRQPCL